MLSFIQAISALFSLLRLICYSDVVYSEEAVAIKICDKFQKIYDKVSIDSYYMSWVVLILCSFVSPRLETGGG